MSQKSTSTCRILISFVDNDRSVKNELLKHLKVLQRVEMIDAWDADRVRVGEHPKTQVEQAISTADLAILLVSSDWLASEFAQSIELPLLLARRELAGMPILPVIIRTCAWQHHPVLGELKVLPTGGKAILAHAGSARDQAYIDVVTGIANVASTAEGRTALADHRAQQPPQAPSHVLWRLTRLASFVAALALLSLLGWAFLTRRDATTPMMDSDAAYCGPGRQRYEGACVSNKMVDFVICLRENATILALARTNAAIRRRAQSNDVDNDGAAHLRDDVQETLRVLPPEELESVMRHCHETAGAAGLLLVTTAPTATVTATVAVRGAPTCRKGGERCDDSEQCCSKECTYVHTTAPYAYRACEPHESRKDVGVPATATAGTTECECSPGDLMCKMQCAATGVSSPTATSTLSPPPNLSQPSQPSQPPDPKNGTLIAVLVGGTCAFSINDIPKGSGSSIKLQLLPGAYAVSCRLPSGTTKKKWVAVNAGSTATAMFKVEWDE